MLGEIDALSDDHLRSVLRRLDATERAAVAEAFASLREAVTSAAGGLSDRHTVSIPTPRSSSTLRGVERHD
jgi:hypothetical protein